LAWSWRGASFEVNRLAGTPKVIVLTTFDADDHTLSPAGPPADRPAE